MRTELTIVMGGKGAGVGSRGNSLFPKASLQLHVASNHAVNAFDKNEKRRKEMNYENKCCCVFCSFLYKEHRFAMQNFLQVTSTRAVCTDYETARHVVLTRSFAAMSIISYKLYYFCGSRCYFRNIAILIPF